MLFFNSTITILSIINLQRLCCNEFSLLTLLRMLLDEVRKEEKFQDEENDEEFDENNCPQSTPQPHIAETIIVEVINPIEKTSFLHVIGLFER